MVKLAINEAIKESMEEIKKEGAEKGIDSDDFFKFMADLIGDNVEATVDNKDELTETTSPLDAIIKLLEEIVAEEESEECDCESCKQFDRFKAMTDFEILDILASDYADTAEEEVNNLAFVSRLIISGVDLDDEDEVGSVVEDFEEDFQHICICGFSEFVLYVFNKLEEGK